MDNKRAEHTTVQKLKDLFCRIMRRYLLPPVEQPPAEQPLTAHAAGTDNAAVSDRLRAVGKGLCMAALSFLLSCAQTALGARPMGMSLLFASPVYLPYLYAGSLVASLFCPGMAIPYALAYTAALALRIFLSRWLSTGKGRPKLFAEPLTLRLAAGVTILFLLGAYRTVSGGLLYYDLFASLFEMAAFAAGTMLFYTGFSAKKAESVTRELGLCGLLCAFIFSVRDVRLFGFALAPFAVFLLTLYLSKTGGAFRATVFGLLGGLMYSVIYAPAFAVAGLFSGLLWRFGAVVSTCASLAFSLVCGICVDGFAALYKFLPDLMGAAIVFLPLAKLNLLPRLPLYGTVPQSEAVTGAALILQKQQQDADQRLSALSDAFARLSDVFYSLSDKLRRPGIYELRQLCADAFERSCGKCRAKSLCHGTEQLSTRDVMDKIGRNLAKNGGVDREALFQGEDSIPAWFVDRCQSLDGILCRLQGDYNAAAEEMLRRDRTEAFAMDYAAMSKLLSHAIRENRAEYEPDVELSEKLRETMQYLDFHAAGISVYGGRRKSILAGGVDLTKNRMTAKQVREAFERACGIHLTMPQYSIRREYVTMSLSSARQFRVESVKATSCKEGEEVNGDMIHMFENKEDYSYMLLSDGMGSGRDAAVTSRICGVFITKMLQGGNSKPVTLEMLNNFIRSKNTECFSTVDLLEVDLLTGEAGFIKSGAAASYVLRQGNLYKIDSRSMPIGITREMNAEEIRFALQKDDLIVMVSDGVAQNLDDGLWLADLITGDFTEENEDLQKMADEILARAKAENDRSDDMTVGLMRVKAA